MVNVHAKVHVSGTQLVLVLVSALQYITLCPMYVYAIHLPTRSHILCAYIYVYIYLLSCEFLLDVIVVLLHSFHQLADVRVVLRTEPVSVVAETAITWVQHINS